MGKVVESDRSNLVANAKAGLINNVIASLFQQVSVLPNGKLISSSKTTYAYRATLNVLLGYNHGAKDSYLTIQQRNSNENGFRGSGWC